MEEVNKAILLKLPMEYHNALEEYQHKNRIKTTAAVYRLAIKTFLESANFKLTYQQIDLPQGAAANHKAKQTNNMQAGSDTMTAPDRLAASTEILRRQYDANWSEAEAVWTTPDTTNVDAIFSRPKSVESQVSAWDKEWDEMET